MNNTLNIQVEEFDNENFDLSIFSNNHADSIQVEGTIELEEEDSLWGDQVSATHLVAKVDSILSVNQFNEEAEVLPYVSIEFARQAIEAVREEERVLDTKYYSLNHNL